MPEEQLLLPTKRCRTSAMARILFIVSALLSVASGICSEPSVTVKLAPEAIFASGSVIAAGTEAVETFDVVVSGMLAEMNPDSVSVRLNGNEIVGFARLTRMSSGFRAYMDLRAADHPHFALVVSENDLEFVANDREGHAYRGSWTINAVPGPETPVLSGTQLDPPPIVEYMTVSKPEIRFSSDPPVHDIKRSRRLTEAVVDFEVIDAGGIRSVFIHLNGKELEHIQLRNGIPSRRRGKFRRSPELPGTVKGGSQALQVRVPVPLRKAVNLVRIAASNVDGVEVTESFVINRPR